MLPGNYKKKTKTVFLFVLYGIIAFSLVMVSSCSREKTTVEKSAKTAPASGPIIDTTYKDVTLEQMGVNADDPQSLAGLGDMYFENGRFKEAIETYEKVVKLNPNDVDTYNDLGLAYHYMGKPDLAVDRLRKGTEVVPSYQRIWLSLGFVLLAKGLTEYF